MTKDQYITKVYMNEDQFQAATYIYINNNYPMLRQLIFHVPNEGAKDMKQGAKLKSMGVIAGVPDLICMSPVFGLELKMPNGRLSPAQKDMIKRWEGVGVKVHVCYSAIEVINTLNSIL